MPPVEKLKVDVLMELYLEVELQESDTVEIIKKGLLEQVNQHLMDEYCNGNCYVDAREYHVLFDDSEVYNTDKENIKRFKLVFGLVERDINSPIEDTIEEIAKECFQVLPETFTIKLYWDDIEERYYEAVEQALGEFGIDEFDMEDIDELYETNIMMYLPDRITFTKRKTE